MRDIYILVLESGSCGTGGAFFSCSHSLAFAFHKKNKIKIK